MIALLQGVVVDKNTDEVIIDVHGVGYRVFIPLLTLEKMPDCDQSTRLFIHTQVREDAFHLYGFASAEERTLFRQLLGINGIGPKLALAMLSVMTPTALVQAIAAQDLATLIRIPGIGKKTGQRILMEMKDRISSLAAVPARETGIPTPDHSDPSPRQIIKSALINLGYKGQDADRALQSLPPEILNDIPQGIRSALKVLTP
ncbi:MAG: Holliday junction branch migration protein RuvA [Magnetococcales bacterium]|nr:Holliday junction branch migration protein RuvA [Magnetococcales bacterium]